MQRLAVIYTFRNGTSTEFLCQKTILLDLLEINVKTYLKNQDSIFFSNTCLCLLNKVFYMFINNIPTVAVSMQHFTMVQL